MFLNYFLVNISRDQCSYWQSCFNGVFSTSKRSNADEHPLIQLSFSTKYQRWNNIGSLTVNWRNSFNVVSMLFCRRWNNVNKHTSAQLSISTKFQCWNNIVSSTLNQRNSIDVASTLFCQRWNNVDKCTLTQLSCSNKYQRWNNVVERWRSTLFQRWFNFDVFAEIWRPGTRICYTLLM